MRFSFLAASAIVMGTCLHTSAFQTRKATPPLPRRISLPSKSALAESTISSSTSESLAEETSQEPKAASSSAVQKEPFFNTDPSVVQKEQFFNTGPFAVMAEAFEIMGLQEGKSVIWGFIGADVDSSKQVSPEKAEQLRAEAAVNLYNIGQEERQRRDLAGNVAGVASVVYILWASLFGDDGELFGHMLRLAAAFPLFLAVGYKKSAETGL